MCYSLCWEEEVVVVDVETYICSGYNISNLHTKLLSLLSLSSLSLSPSLPPSLFHFSLTLPPPSLCRSLSLTLSRSPPLLYSISHLLSPSLSFGYRQFIKL